MKKLYLVTGASGHLGTVLVSRLTERNEKIRVLSFDDQTVQQTNNTEVCCGDITDPSSLEAFFDPSGYDERILIHCAARITIASRPDAKVWRTNVDGTRNIMEYALCTGVSRAVYVSSVHAIPEKPKPEIITEVRSFSPDLVHGQYAKSKAAAAQIALDYAQKGLDVRIVHPSGIIGPGDLLARNHMIRTLRAMARGRIPVAIEGGYDFVDSRDVADGIIACEQLGRAGECYILSGHYITVLDLLNRVRKITGRKETKAELPYSFVRTIAPAIEAFSRLSARPPLLTPYSVYTLNTNGMFSHEKARKELGYSPRDPEESIQASL